jgi:hypothetical protein
MREAGEFVRGGSVGRLFGEFVLADAIKIPVFPLEALASSG